MFRYLLDPQLVPTTWRGRAALRWQFHGSDSSLRLFVCPATKNPPETVGFALQWTLSDFYLVAAAIKLMR